MAFAVCKLKYGSSRLHYPYDAGTRELIDEDLQVLRQQCFPNLPLQCPILTDAESVFGSTTLVTAAISVVSGFVRVCCTNLAGAVVIESNFAITDVVHKLAGEIREWHRLFRPTIISMCVIFLIDDGSEVNIMKSKISDYSRLTIKISDGERFARSWIQRRDSQDALYVGVLLPLSLVKGNLQARMDALCYLTTLFRNSDCAAQDSFERRLYEAGLEAMVEEAAQDGDGRGLTAVLGQLAHPRIYIRRVVMDALPKIVKKGDDRAISAICAHLQGIESIAFRSLLAIADKGDERLVAAVGSVLDEYGTYSMWRHDLDPKYGYLGRALKKAKVADLDDERLLKVISARLEHRNQEARCAAVKALRMVVCRGNEVAVSEVCSRLEHSRKGVRQAALEALVGITEKFDERAIAAARARLKDRCRDVQQAAETALRALQDKGADVATPRPAKAARRK